MNRLSWRTGRIRDCEEARAFLEKQQSFYQAPKEKPDLQMAVNFINRSIAWRKSAVLTALEFVQNFLSNPTFNPKYYFGIHDNENPCCYNIIMLLFLADKYELPVNDHTTSEELYRRLQIIPWSDVELQRQIQTRLWGVDRKSLETLWVQIGGCVERPSTYNDGYDTTRGGRIPLWCRFSTQHRLEDHPDLPHLVFLEGGSEGDVEWLKQHQPSFYFAEQVETYPTTTIFEHSTEKYAKHRLMVSPDHKSVCAIDELQEEQIFVHPFTSRITIYDMRKIMRRWRIDLDFLCTADYTLAAFEDWERLMIVAKSMRQSPIPLAEIETALINIPESLNTYRLLEISGDRAIYLSISLGIAIDGLKRGEYCIRTYSNYIWDLCRMAYQSHGHKLHLREEFLV